MAIPDFQTIMLPLLEITADEREHSLGEVNETLADRFHLTTEEKKELLPSGRKTRFYDRIGWARTYMKNAGLLESTGRGRFRITERGLDVLKDKPSRIDIPFLEDFDEFIAFRERTHSKDGGSSDTLETVDTPEEMLESAYQSLRQALAQELLERIKKCSPRFFEQLVVDLLVAMGYGGSRRDAGQAVGQSGDGGIDGIIKEDKLGLDVVYVQAKRWDSVVGRPTVQAFSGSLDGQRARKGVLITTSHFTKDAIDYVNIIEKRIVLIDGEQMAQFMVDHGIGVSQVARYDVKRVDADYFSDE